MIKFKRSSLTNNTLFRDFSNKKVKAFKQKMNLSNFSYLEKKPLSGKRANSLFSKFRDNTQAGRLMSHLKAESKYAPKLGFLLLAGLGIACLSFHKTAHASLFSHGESLF